MPCQTVSFPENMMLTTWVVVLHTYNVNDVYLPILSLAYTCNLYGLSLYHISM